MPEETKMPVAVEPEGVENGPASSPSPSKKKMSVSRGKLVLARVTLLDGSLLDVNIEVRRCVCVCVTYLIVCDCVKETFVCARSELL
jgi:hypothetical protein